MCHPERSRRAALRLEDFWNDLSETHSFHLFCAYPLQDVSGKAYEAEFAQICQHHSQVIPSDGYTQLSEEERIRTFTLLQQKARSLEIEVAEHKAVQARLRTLAAIVESSDDAILSKDMDGIVTSWNAAAERVYGYSAQEMIGQSVARLFPPDLQQEFEQIMEHLRHGERVDHHKTRRVRKDGSTLTVSVTVSPVKDETGTIIGASDIARDITEQQRLEARSHQLFASNLVGVFVSDFAGTFLEANDAFLDLLGYTREELASRSIQRDALTPPELHFLSQQAVQALQKEGTAGPYEKEYLHKSGKHIPVLIAVTRIEQTETCIGFVLDISERKALEQRKDEFIGMASHELKTPVTSLKGFLGILRRQLAGQENEKILHYVDRMDAQIDKLTTLINDLLDVSRMQKGQLVYRKERVEVDALVQEIVENVQETMQTHHLQIEGQAQTEVFGDRDRLGQVLTNLLTNAIKYSPKADRVIVRLAADETHVLVSVQDFGLGIAKEHHHKIFERFYQVTDTEEKTYPGLGIGLAICREIVKRHGGRLWVESQKGKGSTFHLSLPLVQKEGKPTSENEKGI
jgi:PAS domain S-box-containing protein